MIMLTRGQSDQIKERYGLEYILRMTAEEASELCQAALKYVRALRDNETPVSPDEALITLLGEMADVYVMLDLLEDVITPQDRYTMNKIRLMKEGRMCKRLLE